MTVFLFCNIGNSDLIANRERPRHPRPEGKALWETYEQHQFTLPIIEPCLHYLLRDHPRIDQLVLFDTDQPAVGSAMETDRHGVPLRDKDTYWFGLIIERYVREHFAGKVDHIRRIDLQDINPSMYDEAFDAYGQLLAELYQPDVAACYVLMAGGIPACNTALHLQAISAYGERCHTIYQPEGSEPYELRVGRQVLSTFRRATLIDALERHDFATALTLAQPMNDRVLSLLVAYAHYREAFDFERAQQALREAQKEASGSLRPFLAGLRDELEELQTRETMGALLQELLANAEITFNNGRYADFLGRVFRFQEATLRYIVESIFQLPTDFGKAKYDVHAPAFRDGIASNPELHAFLSSQKVSNKPLNFDSPTMPVLQAFLSYLVKSGKRADGTPYVNAKNQGRYGEVRKRLDQFSKLSNLRNQSIIAHGFIGVSDERVTAEYGQPAKQVFEDMRKILDLLNLGVRESPFAKIAEKAIERVRSSGTV